MTLVLTLSGLAVGMAAPASAAPVYELEGEWEANTPGQPGSSEPDVGRGDIVNAIWRANVNSDLPAPTNEPVPNVTMTVTLENGVFDVLPEVCFTGAAYDPRSSLSDDKKTMVCNLGTVDEGSAVVLQTAIIAEGPTGSAITASADLNGEQVELPPVPIVNAFGMDMLWGTPSDDVGYAPDGNVRFSLDWTLYQDLGSDQGPNSVAYELDVALANGQALEVGQWSNTPTFDQPCSPKVGNGSPGHPFSRFPTASNANFAPFLLPGGTCTLTQTGPTTFQLTLTGIDYSLTHVPTLDSLGDPLPTDQVAIASGQINLKLTEPLASSTSVRLTSSTPTYTSVAGATDVDDPANNISTKTITQPGDWSHIYLSRVGGNRWDASYQAPPGGEIFSATVDYLPALATSGSTLVGDCAVIDNRYVDYTDVEVWAWEPGNSQELPAVQPGTKAWYVGNDPTVDPTSGSYDPDAFRGCASNAGWVFTEPADPTTVKAVRVTGTAADFGPRFIQLRTYYTIQDDAPIGQDIWTWGSRIRGGVWDETIGRADSRTPITPTPGLRYNGTNVARDLVTVIFATPAITKRTDRPVLKPGESATFTLTYSANGAGSMPPTVDDYRIVDTLPIGMTYVPGSATPEPSISPDGRTLTWELDAVPTNAAQTLTYQAQVGMGVDPGDVLRNTVTATLRGESRTAAAQVTTSTNGYTQISKSADTPFIPNTDGSGDGEGSWTVNLRSFDPLPQAFTDIIDILPYEGDGRGTDYEGSYSLTAVDVPDGQTVYYTDADPSTLSDDPAAVANGAPNAPSAMWSTTQPANPTAVRVVGPALDPGATQSFRVHIATDGANGEDVFVNRAQGRAEHTRLVMRTSAPMTVANYYSAALKKFVQDRNGEWRDANDVADYPAFKYGDVVKYRIVVTNTGQGTLNNLDISDDKQPELGEFHVDSLAPGESAQHEYSITLDDSVDGTVVNTACAAADTPADSQVPPTINCDPAGFEVANYTTVKTADPTPGTEVYPGQKVTYTVTVTQQGSAPAVASFSDDLTDVLDDARYNRDVQASVGAAEIRDGRLVWSGTIPVGGVATVTYSVTVKAIKNIRKDGSFGLKNVVASDGCVVLSGQTANCDTEHPVGKFDLKLKKKVIGSSNVMVGQKVRYRLQVTNRGPSAASAPIRLTDRLPKGLRLVKARGKGWDCRVRKGKRLVKCTLNKALAAREKARPVTVVARPTKAAIGRKLVNVAKIQAAGDGVKSNNRSKARIRVRRVPSLPNTGFRVPASLARAWWWPL